MLDTNDSITSCGPAHVSTNRVHSPCLVHVMRWDCQLRSDGDRPPHAQSYIGAVHDCAEYPGYDVAKDVMIIGVGVKQDVPGYFLDMWPGVDVTLFAVVFRQ